MGDGISKSPLALGSISLEGGRKGGKEGGREGGRERESVESIGINVSSPRSFLSLPPSLLPYLQRVLGVVHIQKSQAAVVRMLRKEGREGGREGRREGRKEGRRKGKREGK